MGKVKAVLQTLLLAAGLLLSQEGDAAVQLGLHVAAWAVLGLSWLFFLVFAIRNRRHLSGRSKPPDLNRRPQP
jgi:hypothetical protein